MNIAITDDLLQLLREKVENGQFPDEEAVVCEALRAFLAGEPQVHPQADTPVQRQDQRSPGPFIDDEMMLPPMTLPRPGLEVDCSSVVDATRFPDHFPGE
jgi:Arc/MetJ-type ribon-helix-helix transcriptional regulator